MSLAFLTLLPSLVNAGVATVAQIKSLIAAAHPGMTDAELNAVCQLIVEDATQQKALADADLKPNTPA